MITLPSGIKKVEASDNATIANLNVNADLLDTKITKLDGIATGAGTANSATDTVIGTRTIDDTITAAAGADTPTRLWSKLANVIKGVMGTANWYTLPSMTIAAIITALGLKAPSASPTFTGTVTLPSTTNIGNVSSTELGYLDGVTSAVQTQLGAKAPLASPALTGTPTVPTAVVGTNTTQAASTAFANAAVADKITNKVTVSTTAPSSPAVGDIWIDMSV
ncbi:hypothetical protein [Paenibacillus sp. YIM B09110]|uniref:hypothetical protein n=1 Tax=Paenibacillus sp. YIM B09110 TaxID=3126102 RepID=UPI00301D3220